MDTRAILELHKLLLGEFAPDLTLLLDVPVAAGMQRMQARGDPDRFEIEDEAFLNESGLVIWIWHTHNRNGSGSSMRVGRLLR